MVSPVNNIHYFAGNSSSSSMPGDSVSANIISSLGFLRILPTRGSKVKDTVGFTFWMVLAVGCSSVFVYSTYVDDLDFSKTIPGIFGLLSGLIVPVTQVVLTVPSLYYLCSSNPGLLWDRKLPSPRRPLMFLGVLTLHLLYYAISVFTIIVGPEVYDAFGVITKLYFGLWTMARVLTCFVIGTSSGKTTIRKHILVAEMSSEFSKKQFVADTIKEYCFCFLRYAYQ